MASAVPSSLIATAKASGRCAPSLLSEERIVDGGVFESMLLKCLDGGLNLSSDTSVIEAFSSALKLAGISAMPDSPLKTQVLAQRRCLLLAVTGSTAEVIPRSPTLKSILEAGFLVEVKAWLDDILTGIVGGMDLLLHLLTNIAPLPVTKEMVTTCRLGKAVVAVLKHNICLGSPNEKAISSRVQNVKMKWSEAVKALKNSTNVSVKRTNEGDGPAAKKVKREAPSKPALSSLLKKVQHANDKVIASTENGIKEQEKANEATLGVALEATTKKPEPQEAPAAVTQKKVRKIRWADSTGDNLAVAQEKTELKVEALIGTKKSSDPRVKRWAKKKDITHEKEMLLQSRKSSQLEDDKEDLLNAMAMMAGPWKAPPFHPEDKENPPVQVQSKELSVQAIRMNSVPAVQYSSDDLIPLDPNLVSEVEKALDIINSQPPKDIPFFAPPPATPVPAVAPPTFPAPPSISTAIGATVEQVLAMGLPLFLVGSNLQALQTLVANPSLLIAYRDASGNYEQNGLLNLVSTLSQQLAPPQATQTQTYAGSNLMQNIYQPPPAAPVYSAPAATAVQTLQAAAPRGYRGDQNLGDANLHLSGYGPTTTTEDIVALFAPYVQVIEIVPKSNFSFVNTRDPEGAKRAREALNGSLLGGMPCRINMATRKIKPEMMSTVVPPAATGDLSSLPRNSLGQVDYAAVTDDRGTAATKNLFIGGYGPGTTEQQLRDLVSPYATVVSVRMMSSYSFVNTTDRDAAIIARQSLRGTILNGGPLRINFAKETGRLGTSFGGDSTYGPAGAETHASAGVTTYGRFR